MIALENVQIDQVGEWLNGSGPHAEVVISSRVRLARNLEGYPFVNRANQEQQGEIWDRVTTLLKDSRFFGHADIIDLTESADLDRAFLMERHLISREHAYRKGPRGVAVGSDEMMSLMVNEEDHIRLQVLRSGLCLEDAWWMMDILDDGLGGLISYAFSQRLGFLTACPTNLGSGLRASVMMHLPALNLTRQLKSALDAARELNLSVRGLHGEGTKGSGDMLQLSNHTTLGKSEEEMIMEVQRIATKIASREKEARRLLRRDSPSWLKKTISQAVAMLRGSSSVSIEAGMHCLSMIRLGTHLGLMETVDLSELNGLFITIQPAHLQKLAAMKMEEVEPDIERANLLKGFIGGELRKEKSQIRNPKSEID